MGYEFVGLLAFLIVAIRLWYRTGPRLPLIFSGVAIAGYLAWPLARLPFPPVLAVFAVGIIMAAVERAKTTQAQVMSERQKNKLLDSRGP